MTQARYEIAGRVATVTLDGPQRRNPLTFALYAELRDWFARRRDDEAIKAIVLTGAGEHFCSGGDVHEIIGPLTTASPERLLEFTQMTGDLVKAMRACPQPIVAAIDGTCAGAGAILAMASDLRFGTRRSKVAFLFVRVGLSGADMGACAMLPRIVGLGRASQLLYTGDAISGERALEWGFYNELCEPGRPARARPRVRSDHRRRADARARRDEAHAGPRMGASARRGDRCGSTSAGGVHADARLPARLRSVRREADTGVRRQLNDRLAWPFFDEEHRAFAALVARHLESAAPLDDERDADASCRAWVRELAGAGILRACVPDFYGGLRAVLDVRTLCLAREALAYHSAFADFAFAMQGLGSGAVTLFGSAELQRRFLPAVAEGRAIAAFALSEREAGSDVAAISTLRNADRRRLRGRRREDVDFECRIGGFLRRLRTHGRRRRARPFGIRRRGKRRRADRFAAHRNDLAASVGQLRFEGVRVPASQRIGEEGEGFKVAMAVLDVFRSTVGAAALGFARRALDETLAHVTLARGFSARRSRRSR